MKQFFRSICLVLALLMLAGPVLSLDACAAGYTISGLITTSGSASDTIKVELLQGSSVITEVSAAAKKVTYRFENVAPGTYTLRVSKPGHETYTGTVTVSNADVTRDVTLVSAVAGTYTVSGAIASGGSNSAAITVALYKGSSLVKSVTVTGNSANYSLTGIAPGEYTLKVSKQDHITHQSTITVTGANVVKNVVLGQSQFTLSGHVTSSGSTKDPITVKLLSGKTLIESVTLTGNYAGYTFKGVVPGNYTLEVTKAGHNVSSTSVSVSNANVTKNITLSPISSAVYTISGTITSFGDAAAPIYLELYNGTTLLKSLTLSGNSVKYSLTGIPSGTYHLVVRKTGHNDYRSEVVVNGADTAKNVPMFKIIGGTTVTVSGKLSGMSGTGTVWIYLYVKGKDLPAYDTMRSGNGNYTISGVEPGTYILKAAAPGYDDYSATVIINGDTTHNITMKEQHTCTQDRWFSDGTHHWKACVDCGKEVPTSRGTHMGGEATCVSKAQCGVCDAFYGEFAAHNWSGNWDHSTAAGHSHACLVPGCEALSDPDAHTPNIPAATKTEDQVCTACGYVIAKAGGSNDPADPEDPSDPVVPEDPSDPDKPVVPSDPTEPAAPEPTVPSADDIVQPKGTSWWIILLIAAGAAGVAVVVTVLVMRKKK